MEEEKKMEEDNYYRGEREKERERRWKNMKETERERESGSAFFLRII